MADKKKTYWIGDDGDNKSVGITGKGVFGRGNEIPVEGIAEEVLDEWRSKGLISEGKTEAPVIVGGSGATKALDAEIKTLKSELADAKNALAKSKDSAKAKRVKELEAELVRVQADNEEKAALIEKQGAEIERLTKELDAATASGGP